MGSEQSLLTPRFYDALDLASDLHRNQVRKGTNLPYISHLVSVAILVMEYGGDEDQAIAALLHDSIEDQGDKITLADIGARFGSRVMHIVEGCTEVAGQDGVEKPDWRQRKDAYIAQIGQDDEDTLLIACADKLHNMRSMIREYERRGEALWADFKGGKTGTLWFNAQLAAGFAERLHNPIAAEFYNSFQTLERMTRRHDAPRQFPS